MAGLKISPDLFLEAAELNRLAQFLDDRGFRKNILDNTVKFGLIKNSIDFGFTNGKVERDLDVGGDKTIKTRELFGIDKFGRFLNSPVKNGIIVPNDGNWHWIRATYATSNIEKGIFSISANGDLIDTSGTAELTKIFRGMPNFPTRIRFSNSTYNTLEYDVLEVIDDSHAILQHPATNVNGISPFEIEEDLFIEIIGTFTQGIAVPTQSQKIFNYDSATISLVQETFLNSPPAYTVDVDYYLARVKVSDGTVIIQDKRLEYWETKGSSLNIEIDRNVNPLIGVESVQWDHGFTPSDKNVVKVGWGLRSDNWAIDSSNNIITFNSGLGGKYKTVNDFVNGDLVGGRLYTPSGKYRRIVNSVKQGSAVNFSLDVLDVNDFSNDGGTTFISGFVLAAPDCDSVEIQFTPNPADNTSAFKQEFVFPVNELVGRCDVLVYKDPSVLYNVKYRYKTVKEFTEYIPLPSDENVGYYTESSFDDNGNLRPIDQVTTYTYTSHVTNGYIQLIISAFAYSKFKSKIDKGDIIGVTPITSFTGISNISLTVGTSKNYVFVSGTPALDNDVIFNLKGLQEGNEFRIHFDCTSLNLNGKNIYIVQDKDLVTEKTLKVIRTGDIYQMKNTSGGIVFTCKFKGNEWVMYQNYDLGRPYEFIDIDGVPDDLFDNTTGLGKVMGLYGYVICDQNRTVDGINVPDLKERFLIGQNEAKAEFNVGEEGGNNEVTLTDDNMTHKHNVLGITGGDNNDNNNQKRFAGGDKNESETSFHFTNTEGVVPLGNIDGVTRTPVVILPKYYAVIKAKKVF